MVFFTTFILTLILSYVARAVPACADAAPPEELYEPYEVTFDVGPIIFVDVGWDLKYDDPDGSTNNVTCSNLARRHPHLDDFPDFPNIGAAFDVQNGPTCSTCWKLTNLKTHESIAFLAIDNTNSGFKLGKEVFDVFIGEGVHGAKVEAALLPICGA